MTLDPSLYRQDVDMKDCFLYRPQAPDTSYCAYDRIDVGGPPDLVRHGMLRFDLSSIPADSTVIDTWLDATTVAASVPTAPAAEVGVHAVRSDWSATSVAWSCRDQWENRDGCNPWTPGGDYDPVPLAKTLVPANQGVGVAWTGGLNALAQSWVRQPASNFGLLLRATDVNNPVTFKLAASEHATLNSPRAIITWVPRLGEQSFETMYRERLTDRSEVAVNVANGNLVLTAQDLAVAGTGVDFSVDRTYNSLAVYRGVRGPVEGNGLLGSGWSTGTLSDTALYVVEAYRRATFHGPDGRVVPFTKQTDGSWKAPAAQNATLASAGPGVYTLVFHDSNTTFRFGQGLLDEYALTSISDRNGNTLTRTFGGPLLGQVATVTDTQGRRYTLSYNTIAGQQRLVSVTDPTGRAQRYGYDTLGRLTSVQNGEPGVGPTTYSYGYSNLLEKIIDPAGRETRIGHDIVTRRVTSLTRMTDPAAGLGYVTRFNYVSATTTQVTDARGNRTTYTLDEQRRVTRAVDARGNQRDRAYTANSAVETFTGAATGAVSYTYGANSGESLSGRKLSTGATDMLTYGNAADTAGRQFLPSASRNPMQTSSTETRLSYDTAGNLAQSVVNAEMGKTAVNPTARSGRSPAPGRSGRPAAGRRARARLPARRVRRRPRTTARP